MEGPSGVQRCSWVKTWYSLQTQRPGPPPGYVQMPHYDRGTSQLLEPNLSWACPFINYLHNRWYVLTMYVCHQKYCCSQNTSKVGVYLYSLEVAQCEWGPSASHFCKPTHWNAVLGKVRSKSLNDHFAQILILQNWFLMCKQECSVLVTDDKIYNISADISFEDLAQKI